MSDESCCFILLRTTTPTGKTTINELLNESAVGECNYCGIFSVVVLVFSLIIVAGKSRRCRHYLLLFLLHALCVGGSNLLLVSCSF